MDYETTQKFQPELSSGESLLWAGRARQGIFFRGSDAFLIPFSLLWGGFAMFWTYKAYSMRSEPSTLLFGGAFVLVGLYIIVGRFFADSLRRRGTYYAVTNERILIVSELPMRTVKTVNLATLSEITVSDRPDGSGSITFGPRRGRWPEGLPWPNTGRYMTPMFELSENVKSVYEMIREAQKKS